MAHQKMLCLWGACDRGSGRERLERADRRKGNLLRGRRRRPVGQAVKTPASHAGNAGSIPARVTIVGVDCDEVPPVPIPNTEVKLIGAEDTWLEAARENRLMPTPAVAILRTYSSLAQSVEHAAVNRRVVRSSRTGGAKTPPCILSAAFFTKGL